MKHTIQTKKQISQTLKKFHENNPEFKEKIGRKISKVMKILHKKYPTKWKRNKIQIEQMRQRQKKFILHNPKIKQKCIKAMKQANLKRKYNFLSLLRKQNHSKIMKKYYKTHIIWNKNKKTGLIPKTAFKPGKLHPNYIFGNSFLPYPLEFKQIREFIRQRDNYTCQLCNKKQKTLKGYHKKLDIHHIDYNKNNNKEDNLISLCKRCNTLANFNRDYWYAYFNYSIAGLIRED